MPSSDSRSGNRFKLLFQAASAVDQSHRRSHCQPQWWGRWSLIVLLLNGVSACAASDAQARRYMSLVNQGAVSQEQADQYQTDAAAQRSTVLADQSTVGNAIAAVESAKANVQNARAAVSAAEAEIESANVQLSYASIYAPTDGQLGKLNVNQGNLVSANDTTPLVTLSQVRPIYVEFSILQRQLPELKQYQAQGTLQVEAKSPQDAGQPARGILIFVDSGVDATTGTIKLKARFANANGQLTPGQFVNVSLRLKTEPNAIVVPVSAVQSSQQGSFIYVIQPDQTFAARPVTTGQTVNNQIVIKTGLQVGDRVVVDGQFNLTPGATVQEKTDRSKTSPSPSGNESGNE